MWLWELRWHTALFTKQLRINPAQPNWINRDRFILSAGHGSMLLYPFFTFLVLKMSAWMRSRASVNGVLKPPGHPEFGHTAGVDATTGPLGTRDFNCDWFCPSRTFLAAKYNREGYNIFDHYTYVICGDGDLMEGVSK